MPNIEKIAIDKTAERQTESVVNNWEAVSPKYLDKYPAIAPNKGKNITAYSI